MLPTAFENRMKKLLGTEYPEFYRELTSRVSVRGMRLNTIKADRERVKLTEIFHADPLPYCKSGFILSDTEPIGTHPLHHSGAIYMQDPGAMATAEALDIDESFWVVDLCSAPGGKSSQIAAKLGEGGFILSNEYVPKRAKMMVGNFERLGISSAVVTSLDTSELPKLFRGAFDLAVCDVPCSGEGMFRKSDDALTMWSEENVKACAERSAGIIRCAAPLVKSGGYLLYSTCTYSPEENEMIIDDFLFEHPEFRLIPVKEELIEKTCDGIVFEGAKTDSLKLCRRFYPHKSRGEGQFIALMQKCGISDRMTSILYKDSAKQPTKDELAAIQIMFRECLTEAPRGRIFKHGETLTVASHSCPIPPRSVFSAGVPLGELRGKTLVPSHAFYSAYGKLFRRQIELSGEPDILRKYLRGEQIPAPTGMTAGFCVITYMGAVIGGGKCTGGVINNHYPKGLRNNF